MKPSSTPPSNVVRIPCPVESGDESGRLETRWWFECVSTPDASFTEEAACMSIYCRRWGIPLIDDGAVRLPRLVGEGRAMDLILTGRFCVVRASLRFLAA